LEAHELIPQLFKTEYRKIIAVRCKLLGIDHIDVAEDIANDTFLIASETWGLKGIPENSSAWHYTVAKKQNQGLLQTALSTHQKIDA